MNRREIIEALLFASSASLSLKDIQSVVAVEAAELEACVAELNDIYAASGRSFRIRASAQGYLFVTQEAYAPYVKGLVNPSRLSGAALEVLAVVAYKGPCTKQTIDAIRGVDSASSLKSLLKSGLIDIKAGKPLRYFTTSHFLEVFGLNGLDELPDLNQFAEVFAEEAN
ncbi:MAG: Segregation and condensation protein B [Deltaproteobacteria bacterium ADurb.Bin510]|nr:MAG: Segregation and condensation protein B [Deltaproteobacteria bacterium ADurb.Bin510]